MSGKSYTKNAADSAQVKKASQKEKDRIRQEREDVASILGTQAGRRFFFRYLIICGVFKTSFTGNSETFFKEGQRNVGLMLLEDINSVAPESYAVMMKESREKEEDTK